MAEGILEIDLVIAMTLSCLILLIPKNRNPRFWSQLLTYNSNEYLIRVLLDSEVMIFLPKKSKTEIGRL
jgi:hypothetical protein